MEFARCGDGPPVLVIHGTPGGADVSLAVGQFLAEAGFELVAPSRPGYLGTPLEGCETVDQQADLLAALMAVLGHDRFAVLAWSGGGPAGFRLAVRYPERVSALVPFACVSGPVEVPKESLSSRFMLETTVGSWLTRTMARRAPAAAVKGTLGAEGNLSKEELKAQTVEILSNPRQAAAVLALVEMGADFAHRRAGTENDLRQFAAITSLELDTIAVPTLVVDGDADADVERSHGDYAAAAIAGARRVVVARGTHVCLFAHPDAEEVQGQVIDFLRSAVGHADSREA